jgi:Raf kinase inhibitor-like YbhB/YbcL family protein
MRYRHFVLFTGAFALSVVGVVACTTDPPAPAPAGTSGGTPSSSGTSGGTSGTSGGTSGTSGGTSGTSGGTSGGMVDSGGDGSAATFAVASTAYPEGGDIPKKYECVGGGGESKSPPLTWSGAPATTMSYAIVMRDLNYTPNGKPFIHWAIWDIPANVGLLPEGVEQTANPANVSGAKQAKFNDTVIGYFGPCSPSSVNTYEITLYAIPTGTLPGITTASTKIQAADAIDAAKIASAKLAGKS